MNYKTAEFAEDEAESHGEDQGSAVELAAKIAALQERQLVYEGLKEQLAESVAKQISLTDPEARLNRR